MKKHELFKVLSSEVRLNILKMLLQERLCVSKIAEKLDLAQPTVTQHLQMLKHHGFIKSQKIGYWVHYTANSKGIENCKKEIEEFLKTLETSPKKECQSLNCAQKPKKSKWN